MKFIAWLSYLPSVLACLFNQLLHSLQLLFVQRLLAGQMRGNGLIQGASEEGVDNVAERLGASAASRTARRVQHFAAALSPFEMPLLFEGCEPAAELPCPLADPAAARESA